MTEEIMQTIASHDWPGWASHVVRAKYDPETQKLKTRYADAMDYCVRSVPDGTALPTGFRPAGDGVILIPVNLEGEVADTEGDYYLDLGGYAPQYVMECDVIPIIRTSPAAPGTPDEGVPVDVLTSVLFGLDETAGNITEAELLKVYHFAKDFERFFKKP